MIAEVHPAFPVDAFLADVLDGYEALELLPRGRKIAEVLHRHLPPTYPEAVRILVDSMGPKLTHTEGNGMAPFLYMPHAVFVAEYGLDHFEASMAAQYAITQRFTAEFSMRPFLEQHPEMTLARLAAWTEDASEHVRRLVSECTRPRLPWASRLRAFQRDPSPVLALLERLKDDPSLYVRRSVANNLNDIGKDHPDVLVEVAGRWMEEASAERQWLVRHALRSLVKQGHPGALAVLGFGGTANVRLSDIALTPERMAIGDAVVVSFAITNPEPETQRVLVDFQVHYQKANGTTRPKVFKLKALELAPGETIRLRKKVSVKNMTTRTHYPGLHRVDALLNGRAEPLGAFNLTRASA